MFSLEIPGVGEVEVDSEESLALLKRQLDSFYAAVKAQQKAQAEVPERMIAELKGIAKSNEALIRTVVEQVSKIKPAVTIQPPVVNYTPPAINIPAPVVNISTPEVEEGEDEDSEPELPIRGIRAVKIERDFRGLITSAEFEVIR